MPRHAVALAQVYSLEGSRFMPGPTAVSGSGPFTQRLLSCACSYGVCCLRSVPAQVAGSVLSLQMSLVWIHSS